VVHDAGSTVTLTNGTATVTDAALAGTTNPVSAVEGSNTGTIVLATITNPNTLATAANLTATVDWGDGTGTSTVPVTLIGATAAGTIFQVTGSHTYTEEATRTISITVTTTGGATTTTSPLTATATVADAPITASGTSITGIEGNSTGNVVIATFSDANPGGAVTDFTTGGGSVVVNWGDGSAAETLPASAVTSSGSANGVLFTFTAAHTYAEEGHYQLTVTVTDGGGSKAVASGSATIADAPLTGVAPPPVVTVPEGVLFNGMVAVFNDQNPNGTASEFRATIDWGDGSPQTAGIVTKSGTSFLVSGSHTYADSLPAGAPGSGVPGPQNGTYSMTINITDVGGSQLNLTNTATVTDVALTVTGRLNPASDSGVSNSDNITNVVQPNFFGTTSQPFATVKLYAQPAAGGGRFLIGQAGTDATGFWSITANQALADGSYAITAIAVDSSGHTISNTTTIVPNLVIDTVGPKVAGLVFKPLKGQIQITFQDYGGPGGAGVGMDLATEIDANNYRLTKVHNGYLGQFRVHTITVSPGTSTGSQLVTLTINRGGPIHGGFYDFRIRSVSGANLTGLQDIAGNALDGEFYDYFPSGNNHPGGDFVAQLTAIHNIVYAPSTVIGRATPVSPRGTLEHNTFIPTVDPRRLAPRTAARSAARDGLKHRAARADRLDRPPVAFDLRDMALDQLGVLRVRPERPRE
jgi:hypothetical protein